MAASFPDLMPIMTAGVAVDTSAVAEVEAAGSFSAQPVNWASLTDLGNLALLAWSERRFADALAFYREAINANLVLEPMYIRHVDHDPTLVGVLFAAGRPRTALALARWLVSMSASIENSDLRAGILGTLAHQALEAGDPRAARAHLGAARSLAPVSVHLNHRLLSMLMRAAALEGNATAVQLNYLELSRAIEAAEPGACRYCDPLDYGHSLEALGRTREAIEVYEQERSKIAESASWEDAARRADASLALGKAHRKGGEDEAAEHELTRALAERRVLFPLAGPYHANVRHELGEIALAHQRWDEARVHLTEAVSNFAVTAEPDYPPLARSRFALALAVAGAAGPLATEPRRLAEAARQALAEHSENDGSRAIETMVSAMILRAGAGTTRS